MASITNEPNGRRTVQFVAPDGRRKSVRLGKVSKRQAETVRVKVEELLAARRTGLAMPADVAAWLDETGDQLHDRLAGVGLVSARTRQRLGEFIDDYIASRTDTMPATRTVYQRTRKHLVEHFGEDRALREITAGDADAFRIALDQHSMAVATARRTIGITKQFFNAAMRAGIIPENPFDGLSSAVTGNPDRAFFVTREIIDKVMAASDDPEWRLLIALARFGGMRVPSEPLRLTWGDVDFEQGRVLVRSPKTEHHGGKAARPVPLFPELRPYLDAVRPASATPTDPVITRYRETTVNLRTRLMKTIARAGLDPWPKLWQNMRASRETELVEMFPSHVVAAWLGHSVKIAERHYLQVTDEHFVKAAENPVQKAVQNPVQYLHAEGRTDR